MRPSVLIVDDDEALADNMAEIVQTLGVDTAIAPDRKTALALAAARDFDVALIDVRLPDGDGLSLLAPLRARSPFVQSIMVTGDAAVEGAIAAVRVAAFAYVLKPASPPDLLDTVRRALGQSSLLRERERLRAGTLTIGGRAEGDFVEIDVEDNGPGFPEELPVFDAFFTTKEQGTGLGLSLVHRIVADHGGSIRVESRPGRTCFTLRLPVAT